LPRLLPCCGLRALIRCGFRSLLPQGGCNPKGGQRVRRYETIFILRPDLGDSAQKDAIKRFEGIVGTTGGDLVETEEWGFRELAYRIKGERRGFYVRLDYGGDGATMNEVERNLKLSDGVLRYLSVLVDESADMAVVRSDIEARQKRAAEAKAAT